MKTKSPPPPRSALASNPVLDNAKSETAFYQVTLRVPRVLVWRAEQAMFYTLLVYAALLTAPLTLYVPNTGLDSSWATALNLLSHGQYKFGTDVIFTYGPLGFIETPENIGANFQIALLVRLLIWGLLIGQLAHRYIEGAASRLACFFAAGAVILAHSLLTMSIDYMVAVGAFFVVLRRTPDKQSWRAVTVLAFLTCFAFLSKASGYALLLPSLCAYFLCWRLQDKVGPARGAWLRLALIAGAPILAYLVYSPSVSGLWSYITGVLQISGGYSVAMSLAGLPRFGAFQLGMLTFLVASFAGLAVWRRWLTPEVAACILPAFCLAMKHSVVRTDGHISFVFAFSVVLVALLIMHCRCTKTALLAGVLAFVSIATLSLTEMDPYWGTLSAQYWNPTPHFLEIARIFHWRETMATALAQAEANLRLDELPNSLVRKIGQAPVVPFPNEIAYAPANRLNLLPLYTLQAYSAYTHELDMRTATHLRSSPPDTRLLLTWGQVDDRHTLLDVPATWETIYEDFESQEAASNVLLLKKSLHPRLFHPKSLSSSHVLLREWQDVPNRDYAVSASVIFSQTILGTIRQMLYKIEPVYLELEPDTGRPQRFRVVPDLLQHPFVINCLPLSSLALENLLFQNNCLQRVKRFRFSGEGLDSFSATALLSFTETPEEKFQFGSQETGGGSESEIPPAADAFWDGSIDSVMGPGFGSQSATNPVRVPPGERLEISGWAALPGKTATFEALYAILGKWQFRGLIALRPDVAQYFRKPELTKCGFDIYADTSALPRGVYKVRLVGVARGKYYECPYQLYVRVE